MPATSANETLYAIDWYVEPTSDVVRSGEYGLVVAGATGQDEAAIALEMRKGAPPSGPGSDGSRPLQPTRLDILLVGMSDEALMQSDEVKHGFVVAGATGQDEAAIALEMR